MCDLQVYRDQSLLLRTRPVLDGPDFHGFVLGAAIGDAVGAGVEMQSGDWMLEHRSELESGFVNARRGVYAINYVSGRYTDDTEHFIAVIKAIISGQPMTHELLLRHFRQEFERSRNWIGIGRQGHGCIARYLEDPRPEVIADIVRLKRLDPNPGNAGVMRAAPFAFALDHASLSASVTHDHPEAIAAAVAIALATDYLMIQRRPPVEVVQHVLRTLPGHYSDAPPWLMGYLASLDELPERHGSDIGRIRVSLVGDHWGLRCRAMYTAGAVLYFLKYARTSAELLEDCLLVGGDVDSLASVCLSVFGGMGRLGLGQSGGVGLWAVDSLEGVQYLQQIADDFSRWYGAQTAKIDQ